MEGKKIERKLLCQRHGFKNSLQIPKALNKSIMVYVKILKKIAGVTLIALGIIGLFLPILQGVLLILAGLFLLGIEKKQIKGWLRKLRF